MRGHATAIPTTAPFVGLSEPLFTGQPVVVFGSGPLQDGLAGDSLAATLRSRVAAGANAGIRYADSIHRHASVLATTSYLFRTAPPAPPTPAPPTPTTHHPSLAKDDGEQRSLAMMQGVSVSALWLDTQCGPAEPAEDAMAAIGLSWGQLTAVSPRARSTVTVAATGIADCPLWVSTGVWLVCLAVVSGASSVVTYGITGQSRDHSGADTRALDALRRLGVEVRL